MSTKTFRLAPMSGLILWLTILVFPIPFAMAGSALYWGVHPLLAVAGFMGLVWAVIWFYMRPSHFTVSDRGLQIVWPMRQQLVETAQIESAELVTDAEFRQRWGIGMRIGAGGLFGGFGWYRTRTVTFRFYISRTDEFAIVHLRNDRPLMLTPDDARRFVDMLNA